MKKLFISCPMRGLSDEVIKKVREKMHKLAEVYFDQKLEVIAACAPTEYAFPEDCNRDVAALGVSIKRMASADYFIGIRGGWADIFPGCYIEDDVAYRYNIPCIDVDLGDLHIKELDDAVKLARMDKRKEVHEYHF